ncbi:chemotaxis protein [Yersinia frederiksenii]|uniref:chemotaxis protein n=1 Tax=Yersinia frederiksenii TaxID=29484 RepID=UPI0011A01E5C|nr:chemotaxis protein [Yersinia frederiksenii]
MANKFDFELTTNAQITESVKRINKAVKELVPQFYELRKSVVAVEQVIPLPIKEIEKRLEKYNKSVKSNAVSAGLESQEDKTSDRVKSIYKLTRRANLIYTASAEVASGLNRAAEQAHTVNTAARNVSAPISQFSQVSGAMRIRSAEENTSIKSTEQLYSKLNDMLWGHNEQGLAQLRNFGFDIISNKNGTADVPATMVNIASGFLQMDPKAQSILISTLGLDSNAIELLREGVRLKDLLAKSTRFGLMIDPELNTQLTELDRKTNELSVAWDGLKDKVSNKLYGILVSDGSIADGIGGVTDLMTYGLDSFAIMRTLGGISGEESDKMRSAYNDADFYRQLNRYEKEMLKLGLMTDGFRKKYQDYSEFKNAEPLVYKEVITNAIPGLTSSPPEPNPLTDIFNLGNKSNSDNNTFDLETENTWNNNRVRDLTVSDPYSLEPSITISPDGNLVTSSENISPNDNIVSNTANISPIYSESVGGFNAGDIADVIATAMQNNRVQIELTLIDSRTGESSVLLGQGGGRISYAMAMPM